MSTAVAIPTFPAERVEPLRTRLDWTQQELADRIGVSRSLVNHWEEKRREPRGPAAKLLAQLEAESALAPEVRKKSKSA